MLWVSTTVIEQRRGVRLMVLSRLEVEADSLNLAGAARELEEHIERSSDGLSNLWGFFPELDPDRTGAILEPFDCLHLQLTFAQQRHHAANDAVVPDERLQDALHRGFQVERARQRLADLEQGGEAAGVARGGGIRTGTGGRHVRPPTFFNFRLRVLEPAAGGLCPPVHTIM